VRRARSFSIAVLLSLAACARPAPPPAAPPPQAEPARAGPSDEARAEAEALVVEAKALLDRKHVASARPVLERAARLDPTNVEAQLLLAESYWGAGRWDEGLAAAERGRDADPASARAAGLLTRYYAALARDAELETAGRRWIELGPGDATEWKALSDAAYDRRNYALCADGAEGALRAIESAPRASLSDELKDVHDDMRRSRGFCRQALASAPAPAAAAPSAAEAAPSAAEAEAREKRVRRTLDGIRLLRERRFSAAAMAFERVLQAAPDDVDALVRLADARWRGGRREEALEPAKRALELEPNHGTAVASLAVYHSELERWQEAEAYYRRFAELSPGDAWPWSGLGLVGHESESWALCTEGYERSLAETGKIEPSLVSERMESEQEQARTHLAACRAKRR
jgi:tetratricopeptide (TPR) repeat protein